jgi:hypothetical protein
LNAAEIGNRNQGLIGCWNLGIDYGFAGAPGHAHIETGRRSFRAGRQGRLRVKRRTRNGRNPGEVPLQASGGSPEHLKGQDEVRDSGCVLVCTSLDGLTRLGDVLTGSRRGVASAEKHCRAKEGE